MDAPSPDTLYLDADGATGYPNAALPVLIYRHVVDTSDAEKRADAFERLFQRHHWLPAWRYHLYDFDHFHSTAHEALGIFRGQALARLGGPNGRTLMLYPGDVLVLPAGVGHASLTADDDFCMVGAYPPNQQPEIELGGPARLGEAQNRAARVAIPEFSPVGGPLSDLWQSATP